MKSDMFATLVVNLMMTLSSIPVGGVIQTSWGCISVF